MIKEIQENLIEKKTKKDELHSLFSNLSMYDKKVLSFGNENSKIIFLAESPMKDHCYNSNSDTIFKFDLNHKKLKEKLFEYKSGDILIKVFKELNKKIEDFYWTNAYKIPIEDVKNLRLFSDILEKEIEIIDPDMIICLGYNAEAALKKLDINVNIEIKKIWHPAYISRNGFTNYNEYLEQWRKIFK